MRTSTALLLASALALPATTLAEVAWLPTTTTEHFSLSMPSGMNWFSQSSTPSASRESKTKPQWTPSSSPTTTSSPESKSSAAGPWTSTIDETITISISSCPAGCPTPTTPVSSISTTQTPASTSASAGAVASSSALAMSVSLGAGTPTTMSSAAPKYKPTSSVVTYTNASTGIAKSSPTLTVPASGAVGSAVRGSLVLVGVVGVLFAML